MGLLGAVSCSGVEDPGSDGDVESITITRSADTIDVGSTLQLTAVARGRSGAIVTPTIFWVSSDMNHVVVSEAGLVTGRLVGGAEIMAMAGGAKASVTIRVRVPAFARYTVDTIGFVLGPSSVGQQPGETTGTPDVSVVELPDGRIRLYHGGTAGVVAGGALGTIGSAISSDGVHFTAEAGVRRPAGAPATETFASPLVYPLPDGRYRLYYNGCHQGHCGVSSSTSADGLSFTADTATGLASFTTFEQPACGGIVPVAGGRYRMYCSQTVSTTPTPAGTSAVFSATSSDLLNWTQDSGVRIGPGAPALTLDARHPTAIVNLDGTISLIFYRRRSGTNVPPLETIATSKDGLMFDVESDLGIGGTEPSLLKKRDGSIWIYYGNHSPATGSVVSVGRLNPIVR